MAGKGKRAAARRETTPAAGRGCCGGGGGGGSGGGGGGGEGAGVFCSALSAGVGGLWCLLGSIPEESHFLEFSRSFWNVLVSASLILERNPRLSGGGGV